MENNYLNIVISLIFLFIGGMVFYKYSKVRNKIDIATRSNTPYRIGFVVLIVMSLISLIFGTRDVLDYVRTITMVAACSAYLLTHEGVGREGIVKANSFTSWQSVSNWDYGENKKDFYMYVITGSTGKSTTSQRDALELRFDKKNKDAVIQMFQTYAKRKYTRMKKA